MSNVATPTQRNRASMRRWDSLCSVAHPFLGIMQQKEAHMRWRGIRGLIGLLALVALAATACTTSSTTGKSTPTATNSANGTPSASGLATVPCKFSPAGPATCYRLTVPEDRANPHGAKVQLAAAVLKSSGPNPPADPIIFLQGGPGGGVLQDFGTQLSPQILSALFGNRDVILLDQRGTGYSTPSLQCSEIVGLQYQTSSNLPIDQQVQQQNNAITACHTRLTKAGVHLGAYTTLADANDVHDLIVALGYSQVDLYGVSYGTRLALEVMRSFPARIRSVVLDSTVPPQLRLLTSIPSDTERVFKTLWDGCAKDAACSARYPNLEQTFYGVYNDLQANPITFETQDQGQGDEKNGQVFTVYFHGDDLVNLLFSAFYDPLAIPQLPKMIYQLKVRDTSIASSLYGQLIFDSSVAWGMYYSVECAEDVDLVTAAQIASAGQAYPAAIRADQVASLQGEIPGCQTWNVSTVSASESQPVSSAIPTLILEGEYDPITPPANGDLVGQTLSNSSAFLIPGVGHGVLFNDLSFCATKIAQAFWTTPASKPDGSCVSGVGEPNFQ
jgi:pimeloyl-ACP methyl ester carboxylesterase